MVAHAASEFAAVSIEMPLLVVSSHLDDAALSCGRLLAAHSGAVVVTVFGGRPAAGTPLTPWDRDGGFTAGEDPIAVRRNEDRRALAVVGATPVWLDFVDHQYGQPQTPVHDISAALSTILSASQAVTVLIPLGLIHPDHKSTAAACLDLVKDWPRLTWLVYEEGLYRGAGERERDRAFAAVMARGLAAIPACPPGDTEPERKRAALACYRSQLRAAIRRRVPMLAEATTLERYWRLEIADR